MVFIKKCSIGNKFIGMYYDKEKEVYVCTEGVQVDDNCSDEDIKMLTEEMADRIYSNYSSTNIEEVIEEMMARICEELNEYFFAETQAS